MYGVRADSSVLRRLKYRYERGRGGHAGCESSFAFAGRPGEIEEVV